MIRDPAGGSIIKRPLSGIIGRPAGGISLPWSPSGGTIKSVALLAMVSRVGQKGWSNGGGGGANDSGLGMGGGRPGFVPRLPGGPGCDALAAEAGPAVLLADFPGGAAGHPLP